MYRPSSDLISHIPVGSPSTFVLHQSTLRTFSTALISPLANSHHPLATLLVSTSSLPFISNRNQPLQFNSRSLSFVCRQTSDLFQMPWNFGTSHSESTEITCSVRSNMKRGTDMSRSRWRPTFGSMTMPQSTLSPTKLFLIKNYLVCSFATTA